VSFISRINASTFELTCRQPSGLAHHDGPFPAEIGTVHAPTIGFDLLYVLVIVQLERRKLVWINVTPHPTAEWIARQITEAFPWSEAPRYLIRDRDRVYGAAVTHRLNRRPGSGVGG